MRFIYNHQRGFEKTHPQIYIPPHIVLTSPK